MHIRNEVVSVPLEHLMWLSFNNKLKYGLQDANLQTEPIRQVPSECVLMLSEPGKSSTPFSYRISNPEVQAALW